MEIGRTFGGHSFTMCTRMWTPLSRSAIKLGMAADLWKVVADLARLLDNEIVFIGGVAVYVHTLKHGAGLPPEMTHDADAAISLVASGTVRDHKEFVTNKRLKKAQITVDDIEVDLYVERHSGLRFDYVELEQYAARASIGKAHNVQIASLGHLLILKLDALRSRGASSHGAKDRRDVAKILVMLATRADDEDLQLVVGSATGADISAIARVLKSTAFMEVAKRNAQAASKLRAKGQLFLDRVQERGL
jgi:predicted nucleotidyltransferase